MRHQGPVDDLGVQLLVLVIQQHESRCLCPEHIADPLQCRNVENRHALRSPGGVPLGRPCHAHRPLAILDDLFEGVLALCGGYGDVRAYRREDVLVLVCEGTADLLVEDDDHTVHTTSKEDRHAENALHLDAASDEVVVVRRLVQGLFLDLRDVDKLSCLSDMADETSVFGPPEVRQVGRVVCREEVLAVFFKQEQRHCLSLEDLANLDDH
mmetsp:Transcript_11376/g.23112  ORF Transcript_11376/g.23112 Transcript_11376/m.23112 type:complete len:211 (+) Transcript_11376:578-1210(+)